MLSFIEETMLSQLERDMAVHKYSQDDLVNMVKSGNLVRELGHCIIHGCSKTKKACCRAVRATMHFAGPPCVDWSTQNTRSAEIREFGTHFLVTLCWCAQRLLVLEPIVLHENILNFKLAVLVSCLSTAYAIFPGEIDLAELGWPVHRRRRLTLLLRLDLLQVVHYPWNKFVNDCRRLTTATWLDFCAISCHNDIHDFLGWMRQRPTSMFNTTDRQMRAVIRRECTLWNANPKPVIKAALESEFTRALLASECRRLVRYREMAATSEHGLDYLACLVGQEPGDHAQFSVAPTLNTIIRKTVILWANPLGRPFTGLELMSAQGFVCHHTFSAGGVLSSNFMRALDRKRAAVSEQAGNSMPVQFVGMSIMWALCATEISEPVSLDPALATLVGLQKKRRT